MSTVPPTGPPPQDGSTMRRATSAFIEAGYVLGSRYEIRRLLGRGAMGEVWLAYDLKLRVEVALKDVTFRRDDREMVRREVRSARDVVSPNVCRVFDLVEADGRELLSMEYIDGVTLRQVIEERSPLDLPEAQTIASQLLAGLESIHAAGLVHRDVKPENVMITRTGRIVIMDFGLAQDARSDSGSIAGTPAYMSPEQARGDSMDPRTDLFAVGVVLAEMIIGARTREARNSIWEGIRRKPAEIADNAWGVVLRKAIARDRGERFISAREMARALEEITLRVAGAEEKQPYPGLSAFTEKEAEFFFGREAEVEAMLRKLERFHVLALIGSSGAGKSSFLRAGVLPMLPKTWASLICHPGSSPFASLGQALAPQIEEPGLAGEMVRFHEPDVAVSLLRRWRMRHEQVLIVIDQFEELFTLNHVDVQARFAELLGRAVLDADVRILISLRDDFLVYCHDHPALAPIFSELTPLRAPDGPALRRAILQPALQCGYRFEDEKLVESMLAEAGGERGTLPLLAFAASQLWKNRDREAGQLTRVAYESIGGVGGALAQHAEATRVRIGSERISIVREIFRNLVTAHGTRAARQRDELLSVFAAGERVAAEEVLNIIVEARLLTSFEGFIEIVHESLLTAWPRLAQWRAQDAEGAMLRDQLRQAAGLWHERGRPADLLWVGNTYREFLVWRSRYGGGLSESEEQFARAMVAHAGRRKRRVQFGAAAVVAIALLIAVVTTALWRQSLRAERQAREESLRAEAAKVLAIAQLELDRFPTAALAYATRSLETYDTPEARRFAIGALWRGPSAFVVPWETGNGGSVDFSPDGRWFAFTGNSNDSFLLPENGQNPIKLDIPRSPVFPDAQFDPSGRSLFVTVPARNEIRLFSVGDGVLRRVMSFEGYTEFRMGSTRLFTITSAAPAFPVARDAQKPPQTWTVRSWNFDGSGGIVLGTVAERGLADWNLHPGGEWIARLKDDKRVYRRWLSNGREELLWGSSTSLRAVPDGGFMNLSFSPDGDKVAISFLTGILVKSLPGGTERWLRFPKEQKAQTYNWPRMASQGVLWGADDSANYFWDLTGPPDAEPRSFRHSLGSTYINSAFHPGGKWAATMHERGVAFWAMDQPKMRIFSGPDHEMSAGSLAFTADSQWLALCSPECGLSFLPLNKSAGPRFSSEPQPFCQSAALHPDGRRLLAVGFRSGVYVVSADGGKVKLLYEQPDVPRGIGYAALDRTGRLAVATVGPQMPDSWLGVWDLEAGTMRRFPRPPMSKKFRLASSAFGYDGKLFLPGSGGIHRWNVETGEHKLFFETREAGKFAVSADGEHLLATRGAEGAEQLILLDLRRGTSRRIMTHGQNFSLVALGATGRVIVTGDGTGVIRVGKSTGEEPHLLIGHQGPLSALAISADGGTIASSAEDETVRLWPMPDLSKPPLHTLPHGDLLAKLKSLTNVRAVPDKNSDTGYRVAYDPFPGWQSMPSW